MNKSPETNNDLSDSAAKSPAPTNLFRIIRLWAMFGGVLLLAVVVLNGLSVVGSIFGKPFPGDFELTEVGIAIAAFTFLPICQLTAANVSADIFTAKASARTVSFFKLLGSIVALGFSLILLWRMSIGMMDQFTYGYTTSILSFPHWMAFVPILVSLALLACASIATAQINTVAIQKATARD